MSNSIFIRPIDKERLLAIFESVDACFKIWAYGSRVNGGAHAGSDLDLALRTADLLPLPWALFADLKHQIYDSRIPIFVELRNWAYLPLGFQENISMRHEVLYSNLVEGKVAAKSNESTIEKDSNSSIVNERS